VVVRGSGKLKGVVTSGLRGDLQNILCIRTSWNEKLLNYSSFARSCTQRINLRAQGVSDVHRPSTEIPDHAVNSTHDGLDSVHRPELSRDCMVQTPSGTAPDL